MAGMREHNHDHGMSMEFHFGTKETVLFGPWKFDSVAGLIASMFAIMLMAFVYECLKTYVDLLYAKYDSDPSKRPSMWSGYHFGQTFLYGLLVVLGNLIMLIFMTYNVWLCLAVVVGAVVGYFLFGLKRSGPSSKKCGCH